GDDAGYVAVFERRLQGADVVELDDLRTLRKVSELAGESGAVHRPAVFQSHHRLVHGAMIAAVEDKNLIASGHCARDPQRKPVGAGGGCGYLPERKAETRSQQVAEHQRIFGGEYVGKAASRLSADGARHRWWRVAEHRAGIAQAEVVEPVAIDVGDSGASRLGDHDRKWRGPVCHPVHRHSVEEALDAI